MTLKTKLLLCSLMLLIYSTGKAQKNETKNTVSLTATAPSNPVLKGLESNPLVRVVIYVPAGVKEVNYRKIQSSLNAEGLNAIEKLTVYFTDTEPLFSTKNPVASLRPSATDFDIPLKVSLKPGMHYLWFSAVLKPTADIDSRIEFHARR